MISAAYVYSCGNLVTLRRSGFITSGGAKQTQYYNMGYDGYGNMTSISVGNRQLASYDYGSQNGNLRSMTYGNGATVSYTYDILDRVTEEKWNGALKYQYFYNAEGDLAKKLDVTTGKAVNYEYDSLGRLIHSYQTDNGTVQQKTEHLYDSENRLTSQSWQLGDTLYKESFSYYESDGSLRYVEGSGFYAYAYYYDALRRVSSKYTWVYSQDYTYRNNGGNQTTQIASLDYVRRDGGTSFDEFSLSYEYDAVGNISKITGTTRTDQSASYTYDAQGQLTSETNQNGTYTYTYDTYGNIRSVGGAASHSYTYGDSEWLDLLTAYDGKSITYDAIGNPAVWHNDTGDWNLSWANGRQLTQATKGSHVVSYTYDLAGIRDSKTVDGVTYNYITQNGQVVRQTWGGNTLDVIYDNNSKPCELKYNGTLYYYVLNLQGDVIAIVSENGTCVATYTYDAWGNVISQSGTLAAVNPIRYRGYYYDSETGLYYLQSRYYDPQVKRFINADNYASVGQNYLGYNMFAYCNSSPIMRIDTSGLYSSELVLEWATGAAGLAAIDGPLPFGDIIYVGGLLILGGFAIVYAANESSLPNQGPVSEIPDAPPVDAGKQGKHVPGHPNNTPSKSQWKKGENGVRETQEAWKNGNTVKPDGSVRVGRASDGRRIKVHRGKHGYIHGYPVPEVK